MKIAVTLDFEDKTDIRREGIGVYAKHLIKALLDYDKTLIIDVFAYDLNKKNITLLLEDSFKTYPNRIKIFNIQNNFNNFVKYRYKKILYLIYYNCKRNYYCLKKIFNHSKYKQKLIDLHGKKIRYLINIQKKQLEKLINKLKYDAVYVPFVTLSIGQQFNCPKFVQVHDLFTFEHFELFANGWDRKCLIEHNNKILKILAEYCKKGAVFISSSEYTVREHSLKFIPNIKENQTAVIPFPPMVKNFYEEQCLSKEDFKKKYELWEKYIAVPSQNRPNKNWGVIFKAIAKLRERDINLQFVTTGNVAALKSDADLVKTLGIEKNICEIGSISEKDLYMLYKYEDIAIGSTIIEGMGISGQVIEALKVGNIPAVHSKCCGYQESLKAVGLTEKTAELNWFNTDDAEALANYIEDILKNPQSHIKKQRHIIEAYMSITWDNVAQKYIELFTKNKKGNK